MLAGFLERLLKLPSLKSRIEQLEYQISQLQSDRTTELQQSRIDQLEQQIEGLQPDTIIASQLSKIEQLEEQVNQLQSASSSESQLSMIYDMEQALNEKLALLEQQQSTIDALTQRLEILETQESEAKPTVQVEVPEDLPDLSPRLTLVEQQLGCSQPSDEDEFVMVSSIFDMTDVSTETVYFAALKKLVEEYALPLAYPDKTFRGHKPLSRQEFIQHIAALLEQMEEGVAE